MHPPPFHREDRLTDWPDCVLHLYCCRYTTSSVKGFLTKLGDVRFSELVTRLRCQVCGQAPAPAYLCASAHREACDGPSPDWAVELVPEPATPQPYKLHGMKKHLGRVVSEPVANVIPMRADRSPHRTS